MLTLIVNAVVVATLVLLLHRTRLGVAIRAVSCDEELALLSGIPSKLVFLTTSFVGSSIGGLAGILTALDLDMTPTMGMDAFIVAVVAVIVGGISKIKGAVMAAMLLGLAHNLVVWAADSQWQDALTFIVVLVALLVRPEGVAGQMNESN